uniref:Parkin coregulated gene protein homolog n=1 Tax=Rhabditophanes sp. KR3021 TaxID=114890 RepID=A0AC35TI25_9BILA
MSAHNIKKVIHSKDYITQNKRDQIMYEKHRPMIKLVPAFSVASTQKNTEVFALSKKYDHCTKVAFFKNANHLKVDDITKNMVIRFKEAYQSRELPLVPVDGIRKKTISWNVDVNRLDMLSLRDLIQKCVWGFPCNEMLYEAIALEAFDSLLSVSGTSHIIPQMLSEIVQSCRKALDYGNDIKKVKILEIVQKIVQIPHVGFALIPYYKQLLPPLRKPYSRIAFSMNQSSNHLSYKLTHSIHTTLVVLEETGGQNSLINIKYIIPHYQSTKQFV